LQVSAFRRGPKSVLFRLAKFLLETLGTQDEEKENKHTPQYVLETTMQFIHPPTILT